jgi:NADH dehydrogenase
VGASFPLQDAKRAVETRLRESGLTYTILQPTYFVEAWLSPGVGFDYPNRKATIYGTGENPISWISYADVARFAVACLDNPASRNATLELGGPER